MFKTNFLNFYTEQTSKAWERLPGSSAGVLMEMAKGGLQIFYNNYCKKCVKKNCKYNYNNITILYYASLNITI